MNPPNLDIAQAPQTVSLDRETNNPSPPPRAAPKSPAQ